MKFGHRQLGQSFYVHSWVMGVKYTEFGQFIMKLSSCPLRIMCMIIIRRKQIAVPPCLTVIGPCVFHLHVCSMTPRIREFAEACCMCLRVCVDRRPWSAVVSVQHRPASQQVLSVLVSDVEWALCFRRFTLRERAEPAEYPCPNLSPHTELSAGGHVGICLSQRLCNCV